jgi:hypothetical protein
MRAKSNIKASQSAPSKKARCSVCGLNIRIIGTNEVGFHKRWARAFILEMKCPGAGLPPKTAGDSGGTLN